MGLLESVLGSVLNGGQSSQQAPQSPSLGGGMGGGLGGIIGALASNPQLMQVLMSLLSGGQGRAGAQGGGGGGGGLGGLGGLGAQFEQAGLGDVLGSWIGKGQNRPVSADQLGQVFGQDQLSELGAKLGMGGGELASELSQILPNLVDQMTPDGRVPEAPAGGAGGNPNDLFGMLEAFQRR
jgi:uncharacterized protein YidB (DUF937 family)